MTDGIVGGIVADPPIGGGLGGGQGIAGPPGASAYDSYVANGGTLTEAEWAAPANAFPPTYNPTTDEGVTFTLKVVGGVLTWIAAHPTAGGTLDFSSPVNSGLLAAIGA